MKPRFDASPVCVGIVVDDVTKEKVFSKYNGFTVSFTLRRCSIFLFHLFTVVAM
jgi:hypothetical protein